MSILQERMVCKSGFEGLLQSWFKSNFWNTNYYPYISKVSENNWNVLYSNTEYRNTSHIIGYIRRDADGGIFMDIMPEHADKLKRDK